VTDASSERTSAVLSVRFSAEEMDQLRSRADTAGLPVSSYVRLHALADVSPISTWTLTPANASATIDYSRGEQKNWQLTSPPNQDSK
jgi:hypothetical protein